MQGIRYATLLLLLGNVVACGSAGEPPESASPDVGQPSTSPETSTGRRGELLAANRESPSDQSVITELRALDRESREQGGQLMEIEVSPEHFVYVMEPNAGELALLENGKVTETAVTPGFDLASPKPLTRLFAALRPGEALPSVLAEAEERNAAASEDAPEDAAAPAPTQGAPARAGDAGTAPAIQPQHVTSSGNHFRDDQHGCPTVSRPARSFCWLERTGNWTESQTGTYTFQALALYAGHAITWKSTGTVNTVFKGEFWTGTSTGRKHCPLVGSCVLRNVDMTRSILDAELGTDWWHWGGSFSQDPSTRPFVLAPEPDSTK